MKTGSTGWQDEEIKLAILQILTEGGKRKRFRGVNPEMIMDILGSSDLETIQTQLEFLFANKYIVLVENLYLITEAGKEYRLAELGKYHM